MITTTALHSEALASSKLGAQYSTALHVLLLPVHLNYPYHVFLIQGLSGQFYIPATTA